MRTELEMRMLFIIGHGLATDGFGDVEEFEHIDIDATGYVQPALKRFEEERVQWEAWSDAMHDDGVPLDYNGDPRYWS